MKSVKMLRAFTFFIAVTTSALAIAANTGSFFSIAAFPLDTLVFCIGAFSAASLNLATYLISSAEKKTDFTLLSPGQRQRNSAFNLRVKNLKKCPPSMIFLAVPFAIWNMSGHTIEDATKQITVWAEVTTNSEFPVGVDDKGELWWLVNKLPDPLLDLGSTEQELVAYEPITSTENSVTYNVLINGKLEPRVRPMRIAKQSAGSFSPWKTRTCQLALESELSPDMQSFPPGDFSRFLVQPSSSFTSIELVGIEVSLKSYKNLPTIKGVDVYPVAGAGVDDLFVAELRPDNVGKGFLPTARIGTLPHQYLRTWVKAGEPYGVSLVAATACAGIYTYDVQMVTRRFNGVNHYTIVLEDQRVAFTSGPLEYYFDAVKLPGVDDLIPKSAYGIW